MDQPLKSILKKASGQQKNVSFATDTKEEINEFPHVKKVILFGQGIFSPDSKYMIVATEKKLVLYETATGMHLGDLQNSTSKSETYSQTLLFSPCGRYVADKYKDCVWEVATRAMIHQDNQSKNTQLIGWAPEQKIISIKKTPANPKSLFYCQHQAIPTGDITHEFKIGCHKRPQATLAPNGIFLAFGPTDSTADECYQTLFELPQGREICTIPGVTEMKFTTDSKYALLGTFGAKLLIAEAKSGSILKEISCDVFPPRFSNHPLCIYSIDLNAIRALIRTSQDHQMSAWKIPEGERLTYFENSEDRVPSNHGRFSIAFSNVNSESKTCDAFLEDSHAPTKKKLLRKMPTTQGIPIFSPDDSVIKFPTGELFDTYTGTLLYARKGYDDLRFSSDEKHLLVHNGKSDELVSFKCDNP